MGLRLVLSTVGVGVALAYMAVAGYGGTLVLGAGLAGIAILLQGVQAVLTVVLQAELRLGAITAADLVRQVANVVAIVVLVALGAGLLAFFGALIVAGLCGVLATIRFLGAASALRPAFDRASWASLLRLTLPFAVATAIAVVYLRIGLLLLDPLTNERETGLYAVSFRVVEVVSSVPALLVGAAFPIFSRAARDDLERLRYAVQRTFDSSLLLGALVAVTFAAGAPVVIAVIGGPEYEDADPVLRWHALALCGTFAAQPFGFALLAGGRTRGILGMTLAALIVSVGATIPLALAHGAQGAAAAAAAAEWALAITGAVLLRRRGGPRVTYGAAARIFLAGAVAVLPALVLPAIPAALLAASLFVGLAFALRVVPEELLAAFRTRRR
jgi:O-antigen/teichoic acid export membrane protein